MRPNLCYVGLGEKKSCGQPLPLLSTVHSFPCVVYSCACCGGGGGGLVLVSISFELVLCLQYFCVTIPPAVTPSLLRQMDTGSLTCVQTWVCAVHTKRREGGAGRGGGWGGGVGGGSGGQAQTNLRKSCLGGINLKKLSLTLLRQGIEPRVLGVEFRRCKHRATSRPRTYERSQLMGPPNLLHDL